MKLTPRASVSAVWRALAPVLAFVTAFLIAGLVIWLLGRSPLAAFQVYVTQPLSDPWALQEILVKATPLALIAIGLSYCFRANLWNIGAEGQYVIGAVLRRAGSRCEPTARMRAIWVLPAMMVLGIVGGAALRPHPGLSEDPLRRQRNPDEPDAGLYRAALPRLSGARAMARSEGLQFPAIGHLRSVRDPAADLRGRTRALRRSFSRWSRFWSPPIVLGRTLFGYRLRLSGDAPRAARFAGFDSKTTTLAVFAISGGLAGLAGISEVAGQIGQLQPSISPGYGFTAITVAFLGRLNPIGILVAALVVSLTFIGGESAQIMLKLPLDLTQAFQGILLLCVLAADALVSNRVRVVSRGVAR